MSVLGDINTFYMQNKIHSLNMGIERAKKKFQNVCFYHKLHVFYALKSSTNYKVKHCHLTVIVKLTFNSNLEIFWLV